MLSKATYHSSNKTYELTNHLGNVMSTISDRKIPVGSAITHFLPDVDTYQDYFPFGMVMSERSGSESSVEYRYGFNGMEYENELYQPGNAYDFGARVYDGRIGRWFSVDPQAAKQPGWSTYKSFLNNPLIFIDPEGETEFYYKGQWIGTDNNENGLVAIVTDDKVASEIIEQTLNGDYIERLDVKIGEKGYVQSDGMFITHEATIKEAFKVLELAKNTKHGKRGEYGSVLINGKVVASALKGKYYETLINVLRIEGPNLPSGDVMIHSHPTAWDAIFEGLGIRKFSHSAKEPSKYDKEEFEEYGLNIIVGKLGHPELISNINGAIVENPNKPRPRDGIVMFNSEGDHLLTITGLKEKSKYRRKFKRAVKKKNKQNR